MKSELLIQPLASFWRMAHVEDGKVVSFRLAPERHALGQIYRGKVVRLLPALNAAFVDIGLKETVFLPGKELLNPKGRVQDELRNGECIFVQVRKIGGSEKGWTVTRRVSFAGHLVLYMPFLKGIHTARRIAPPLAHALKMKAEAMCSSETNGGGGWVIRTAAAERVEDLGLEIQYWQNMWQTIEQKKQDRPLGLWYEPPSPPCQWLCDEGDGAIVWMQQDDTLHQLRKFVQNYPIPIRCEIYPSPGPVWSRYGADQLWRGLRERRVTLPSGGFLLVDVLETMTIIDVNTGSSVQGTDGGSHAMISNLEAAKQTAKEIRLRNLSGQIWIDFVDVAALSDQQLLVETLKQGFQTDPARWSVGPYQEGGLVRVTRQRSDPAIWEITTAVCAHCQGSGRVPTGGMQM